MKRRFEFQTFFITAEKPKLGLVMTLVSGFANMILDALFMAVFGWGIVGAAAATALSQFIGGTVPLVYFSRPNTSLLRLVKTKYVGKWMLKACTNGSSELMSNISFSLVGILYNFQLMSRTTAISRSSRGRFSSSRPTARRHTISR